MGRVCPCSFQKASSPEIILVSLLVFCFVCFLICLPGPSCYVRVHWLDSSSVNIVVVIGLVMVMTSDGIS